jgi:glycosyltransferase involved in cell wall biosynthesis
VTAIPLSVVIITFNEEKNIGRCLESVQEVADDIVVVDSFSTDRTEEIVRAHGARFIQHPFEGHVEQKNWALEQAAHPHVLSLDADEALDGQLKQSILEVKNDWRRDGYRMNRFTNYCGHWIRHCGWYPDPHIRLFDRRHGSWRGTNPHDKFHLRDGRAVGVLRGDLLHYSYYTIGDHIRQINYFSDIASQALHRQGKRSNLFRVFGNSAFMFFRSYVLQRGFLDGYYGLVISTLAAQCTFVKYAKLRQLQE